MRKATNSGGPEAGSVSAHVAQLDGLRAFAVLCVLIQHGFPDQYVVNRVFPWGDAGVRLFFVLSGFLITRILLDCRGRGEREPSARGISLRHFYIRRALRILPVYFFVLATMALLDAPGVRDSWIWLATFTSNFLFASLGSWPGFINHLWTLAVEEQFYLIWPWVIAFVPRRTLVMVVIATVVSAPVWRALSVEMGHNAIATSILTISCFDSLGMGALLAIARHASYGSPMLLDSLRRASLFVGVPLFIVAVGLHAEGRFAAVQLVIRDLAMALVFTWVVDRACDGFGGWIGRLLAWRPVRYVGKISYGIYLYHRFLRGFLFILVTEGYLPPPSSYLTRFLRIALGSLIIAMLSWHLFEAPINRLKRKFPYERAAGPESEPI